MRSSKASGHLVVTTKEVVAQLHPGGAPSLAFFSTLTWHGAWKGHPAGKLHSFQHNSVQK